MSATSIFRKAVSVSAATAALLAVFLLWGVSQAHAAGVSYVERSWSGSQVVSTPKTLTEGHVRLHDRVEASEGNGFALFDDRVFPQDSSVHWFYADRDETLRERCLVQGDVHLILADGVTITCNDGIGVPSGSSLTIYGQSGGTGKLVARADTNDYAAIGGEWRSSYHAGNITIHGGDITADAYNNNNGDDAAGIGGGYKGDGGTFTMYGGRVWAKGANGSLDGGAGIGGGREGNGGTVRIYGGEVIAYGGPDGAGIGGGDSRDCGSVEIYGGKVTATGGNAAAGIGGGEKASSGDIAIRGGEVTAAGGDEAAGIGGGNQGPAANSGTITISGGTVTATGGTNYGAGIGGGDQQSGGAINITGGESIVATGGKNAAGIGGGDQQSGGTITISGGAISEAKGGENAAGIGGGGGASGGTITVSGGVITEVKGGENAAGIGSGYVTDGNGGTITISGGVIAKAQGGDNGAGIGGGWRADGGTITISAGSVTAVGGGGAGIGGGFGRSGGVQSGGHGGTITISGGTVDATGAPYGAGIGGGGYGKSGTILITAGKVTANGGFPSGAGIGSGGRCNYLFGTTDVTISGGEVRANGGAYKNESIDYHSKRGAGIGAGGRLTVIFKGETEERGSDSSYFGGKIVFNGGTVFADELGASEDECLSGDNTDGVIEFNGGTVDVASGHARADKITFGTHMRIRDVAAGERLNKCKSGEPFLVEPCDHAGSAIVDNGDGSTHKHNACPYCDLDASNEPHAYGEPTSWTWSDDNTKATASAKCACGYEGAFEAAVAPKAGDPTVNVATAAISGKNYTAEAERLVYTIATVDDARGTVEVAETAKAGSTVTFTATPAQNCQLVGVSVDGSPLTEEGGVYSFTMPKKDVTVSAEFKGKEFQITWKNYDGTELASDLVEYGTTPTYGGATPTRPNDALYAYTFTGWEPEVVPVSGEATYTAVYDARWAADSTFKPLVNNYDTPVRFNDMDWYVIADGSTSETSGTLTLLMEDLLEKEVQFDSSYQVYRYANAEIKRRLDALTAPGGQFEAVAHAIADADLPDVGVTGAKLHLISKGELDNLDRSIQELYGDSWWTRSVRNEALVFDQVWFMGAPPFSSFADSGEPDEEHGLRPALRLDLSKVEYAGGTRTFLVKQEVTAPAPAEGLLATGRELDLLASPASLVKGNTGAPVTYSLDGQNWSTDLPKAVNPGDYTVSYKVAGSGVFAEHAGSVKVTVKLVPQGSFETVYGKTLADVALPAGWEWADAGLSVGNVGAHTFKANYTGPDFPRTEGVDVEVAVRKAPNSASVSIDGWTYGQEAGRPRVTADFGAATAIVEYKAKGAGDGAYTDAAPTEPGDYTVRATVPATANYDGAAATADFSVAEPAEWAKFTYSLSLEDCVDVNFYARDLAGDPARYAVGYGPGEEGSEGWKTETLADKDENKVVVASRAAKEVGDEVHVVVRYGGKVIKDARYSVRGYCDAVIGGSCDEAIPQAERGALKDLCRAALDYGSYAQKAFGYKAGEPVNGGTDVSDWEDIDEPTYGATKDDRSEAVTGVTLSLVTTSRTQLVARFKTTATDLTGFKATVDGADATSGLVLENGKIKVVVSGIAAMDLDKQKAIVVTDPDGGTYAFTVSPVDYMGLAVSKSSQVGLNRAFYNYHLKAKAFAGEGGQAPALTAAAL